MRPKQRQSEKRKQRAARLLVLSRRYRAALAAKCRRNTSTPKPVQLGRDGAARRHGLQMSGTAPSSLLQVVLMLIARRATVLSARRRLRSRKPRQLRAQRFIRNRAKDHSRRK